MSLRESQRPRRSDAWLYLAAGVSYCACSIYFKWLLDWIVGPAWLVAWVWGVPAIGRKLRGEPVFPPRPRP